MKLIKLCDSINLVSAFAIIAMLITCMNMNVSQVNQTYVEIEAYAHK